MWLEVKASVTAGVQQIFSECFVSVAHQLFVEKKDRMLVRERVDCSGGIFLSTDSLLLTCDSTACNFAMIYVINLLVSLPIANQEKRVSLWFINILFFLPAACCASLRAISGMPGMFSTPWL